MGSDRVNAGQRPAMEPPRIIELGHVVLDFADYQKTVGWYTEHFGLIPSDAQLLPDGSPLVAFMRLDLGDTPADHHSIAAAQGLWPEYNHSAYEVTDADAVGDFVQWGPQFPVSMVRPKASLRTARVAWHHLRHTPDVSVGKLRSMARLISASRTR
ncbi:hypothetical protein GCM10023080_089220 [Streptomyces pseudoechinosporeus]